MVRASDWFSKGWRFEPQLMSMCKFLLAMPVISMLMMMVLWQACFSKLFLKGWKAIQGFEGAFVGPFVKKYYEICKLFWHYSVILSRNWRFCQILVAFTVSDWVPKKDSANFESDAFLWFAYVVNMSKIATFSGIFWIFG